MKVDHKISFTATAVAGDLKLFDDMKKKKAVVNTNNIKMRHFNCTGTEIVCKYPIQRKKCT